VRGSEKVEKGSIDSVLGRLVDYGARRGRDAGRERAADRPEGLDPEAGESVDSGALRETDRDGESATGTGGRARQARSVRGD